MDFKSCSCGMRWQSREEFLSDPHIEIAGYQVDFEHVQEGFFLFNHLRHGCRTTLSVQAGQFFDLYDGPVFRERPIGVAGCDGMCFHHADMRRCPARCECAFAREVLHVVSTWEKRHAV